MFSLLRFSYVVSCYEVTHNNFSYTEGCLRQAELPALKSWSERWSRNSSSLCLFPAQLPTRLPATPSEDRSLFWEVSRFLPSPRRAFSATPYIIYICPLRQWPLAAYSHFSASSTFSKKTFQPTRKIIGRGGSRSCRRRLGLGFRRWRLYLKEEQPLKVMLH